MPGPVNLNRLSAIYDLARQPDLKYPIFTPGLPPRLAGSPDLFAVIRQNDLLLHHPFQSFAPVMDFVRQAASDPQVLAIKQTLYRTGTTRRWSMHSSPRRTPARTSPSSSSCVHASTKKRTSSFRTACRKPART